MDMIRQLGRPYRSFLLIEEYGVQAIISKETKCRCRESDSSVVPMKLGNADGGTQVNKSNLKLIINNTIARWNAECLETGTFRAE